MTNERKIYLLDPQLLPPETIAVTFAKTSRSPESFRQIAAGLTDQKSSEFNEKWVVGYGHSSVAEHAVLHIAVENVSRLAVECIESNRLASYTEKSTRYQTWQPDAFFVPAEWQSDASQRIYMEINQACFNAYAQFIPVVSQKLAEQYPPLEDEPAPAYEHRIRSRAIDVCRYLLPASSLANVGMTINARALEHAIGKMLSHPLLEVRQIGEEIKNAATPVVPTLLKYAQPIPYLEEMEDRFAAIPSVTGQQPLPWFQFLSFDSEAVDHLLAAAVFRYSSDPVMNFPAALETVRQMDTSARQALLRPLLTNREKHTIPLRELEHIQFQFEITLDQGAFYEVKRHRMLTLTPRSFTPALGFALPKAISEAGLAEEYCAIMRKASQAFNALTHESPQAAAYVLPNAFNRRFLVSINLRSAMHFIALRSELNAHFAVRRLALKMADEIEKALPELAHLLPKCQEESVQSIEEQYFTDPAC